MIRIWLIKHRWVNELGKTIVATLFVIFSYAVWEAGKIASLEINMSQSYKLMVFGVGVGILGTLALFILVDVVYSIIGIIRRKEINIREWIK